ncbi:C6 zinc cluster transcription factor-like protein [Sporothrix curviconia]|uniref:C6 zinc cluster transcription factor-like protein n=1 Tax=Sporothrix curviconia TaxID=1260050 RepID=A0ABP0BY50_9PEZI
MPLEVIYVVRHGQQFRSNWLVNPTTGSNKDFVRLPTGNVADPALSDHGIDQARELAAHLASACSKGNNSRSAPPLPVERVYCSPYYRCLETAQPLVETVINKETTAKDRPVVCCEPGLVDWFGPAPFRHPQPLPAAELQERFFPWVDPAYVASGQAPPCEGETMAQLHARLAAVVGHIIRQCDADGVRCVLLCTHAAPIIALGRVLTGQVPVDVGAQDFGVFTCGLTVYQRRSPQRQQAQQPGNKDDKDDKDSTPIPWDDGRKTLARETWTHGRGVAGGWDCTMNCDCSFLSEGEERGWRFSADDESSAALERHKSGIVDSGLELGVVVAGRSKKSAVAV